MQKNKSLFLMYKFLQVVLLSMLLFYLSLSVGNPLPAHASLFAGGNGTTESPYEIATPEQLNSVRESVYLNKHFTLVKDIYLSEYSSNWKPIGGSESPFSGTFDGNFHRINSLNIDRPGEKNIGLFGFNTGEIKNCLVMGNVTGADNSGILVGQNSGGVITASSVAGEVYGNNHVGGLAGYNGGNITKSSSMGIKVTGGDNVGGLVGTVGTNCVVKNSFAYGAPETTTVSGTIYVGGLVGAVQSGGEVRFCYTAVTVDGESKVGGLAGANYGGTVSDSYYESINAARIGEEGEPKTRLDMLSQDTFVSWDFENTWMFQEGEEAFPYPIPQIYLPSPSVKDLIPANGATGIAVDAPVSIQFDQDITETNLSGIQIKYDNGTQEAGNVSGILTDRTITITHDDFAYGTEYTVTIPANTIISSSTGVANSEITWSFTSLSVFAGGDGTEQSPYQIATADQLNNVRNYMDKNFTLISDIDLSGYDNWNPIGGFGGEPSFSGTFDGNFHTISNLNINRPDENYVGLFGFNSGGEMNNCYVSGNVIGGDNTGILLGYNSTSYYGDPLVEYVGEIINCAVFGSVQGNNYVGGLVGSNNGNITESFSTASVTGNSYVGGLAGNFSSYTIENSYATGDVVGNNNKIGGLVGSIQSGGEIKSSYAAGSVTGVGDVGGLLGYEYSGTVSVSYYDSQTTGQSDTGKGAPKTTQEMQSQSTFEGWDFTNIWNMQEGNYPFSQAMLPFPAADTLTPGDGTTRVALDAPVSIQFDRDITLNDLSGIKIDCDNGGIIQELGNVSATLTGRTITIVHDPFKYGTEYSVTIPEDTVIGSLTNTGNLKITWSFTTETVEILSCSFDEQTGAAIIDSKAGTIDVEVAYGTDVSNLVASFTTSSSIQSVKVGDVKQVSGQTVNDFTGPVTYTVTAKDGSTKDYTVTVTEAQEQSNFGVALSEAGDKIAGNAFNLNISGARNVYGENLSGDINVTVTSDQAEGEVYNGPVTFTVGKATVGITLNTVATHNMTVEVDGVTSVESLGIAVIPPPSSDKEITAFGFMAADNGTLDEDITAVINGTDIQAAVPYGTDVTALVATFSTTGETVEVAGVDQFNRVTANDFSEPVTYIVTAEDGITRDYTVIVTADQDQSGFKLALVETGNKMTGQPFDLNISGARDVYGENLNGNINVTVSEKEKFDENAVAVELYSGPITFTNGDAVVSLTIVDPKIYITTYTLTVDVDGVHGNQELDVIVEQQPAPEPVTMAPVDGAVGIALDAPVSVSFDRDIIAGDYFDEIYIKDEGDNRHLEGVSGTINGCTIVIAHNEFKYDTKYTVVLPQDTVRNNAGIYDKYNYISWSFTTEAKPVPTAPAPETLMPADSGTGIAPSAAVSIQFTGDIIANDLNDIKIEYQEYGTTCELGNVSAALNEDSRTLTIAHDPFAYGTEYTVTVPENAVDNSNGLGNAEITWSFTTESDPETTPVEIIYNPEPSYPGEKIETAFVSASLVPVDPGDYIYDELGDIYGATKYTRKLPLVHIFYVNGTHTFTYYDSQGRKGVVAAGVDWIDQTPKVRAMYSATEPTRSDVTVWIYLVRPPGWTPGNDRGFNITNNNGSNRYVFTENGNFTFEFEDDYGNKGSETVTVDCIIGEKPVFDRFEYNPCLQGNREVPKPTNESTQVVIYVKDGEDGESYPIGSDLIVSENGEYTYEVEHWPSGKVYSYPLTVDWIDKEPPQMNAEKNIGTPTGEDVVVTITVNEEVNLRINDISDQSVSETVYEGKVSDSYHLTVQENCKLKITAEDIAGNESEKIVTVDNICKNPPVLTYTGPQAIAAERDQQDKALELILSYMEAVDANDEDISRSMESVVKERVITDLGDELITYEFYVKDRAGQASNTITVKLLAVTRYSPGIFVNGKEIKDRVTVEVPADTSTVTTAIDFAGFMGEYTVKLVDGERPAAAFKKAGVTYNSHPGGERMYPVNLTPGIYTVYAYDQEMVDKRIVIEVVEGGQG